MPQSELLAVLGRGVDPPFKRGEDGGGADGGSEDDVDEIQGHRGQGSQTDSSVDGQGVCGS